MGKLRMDAEGVLKLVTQLNPAELNHEITQALINVLPTPEGKDCDLVLCCSTNIVLFMLSVLDCCYAASVLCCYLHTVSTFCLYCLRYLLMLFTNVFMLCRDHSCAAIQERTRAGQCQPFRVPSQPYATPQYAPGMS